jgi:hypothetical protein
MKQISIILLSLLALAITACEKVRGEGPVVTENRDVSNFSGIDLRSEADLYYRTGPDYSVVITGQQNVLDVLETYTSEGKLVIRYRGDVRVRSHERLHIQITSPAVNRLKVRGSGDIMTSGPLNPSRMDMDVDGSGSIRVSELTANLIDAEVIGSGNIQVTGGTASEVETLVSGSGDIDLAGVATSEATTVTSGSGDTRLYVSNRLKSTISGSGNVYYRGNPTIETHISGSGRVKKL